MKIRFFAIAACMATQAYASNVGIVDSGTWFGHDWFSGGSWTNSTEIPGNMVDDDRDGYVDDVTGWNFAESLSKVFFPEHTRGLQPNLYKVFEILSRIELETMTPEDKEWWNANVAGLPETQKKSLIDELNWYGQYAHGTHTGGIVIHGNPNAKVMSARIFPDSQPPESSAAFFTPFVDPALGGDENKAIAHTLLAQTANKTFVEVAKYLNAQHMDVANYSIGVPIANIAKQYLTTLGQRDPSADKIKEEAWKFYEAFEKIGQKWMASAPETLFVVAAGNDGSSNEELPIFPANVRAANCITVAATHDFESLAKFSNYGASVVHVAAPGVAIVSSVPASTSNMTLPMSGTSMAAPYVSMVASRVKDANPDLKAADIRRILMETVDKKPWLEGKVQTGGVVNVNRALQAAELSRTIGLDAAIAQSRSSVADMEKSLSDDKSNVRPTAEMQAWARALHF